MISVFDPRRRAILANDVLMILYGISVVMVGTTLPEMISTFQLSLGRAGLIVAVQNVGGIAALIAGTFLADRVNKPITIVVSFLAVGAVLVLTGLAPSYVWLLVVFGVSGIAVRSLDTMLNAFTGELAGSSRSRSMNLLHMFFGVGAFAGPLLAQVAMNSGVSWRVVYVIVGGSYVLVLASILTLFPRYLTARATGPNTPAPQASGLALFLGPGPILLGILLLAYAVHQTGATTWIPHYLRSTRAVSPMVSSAALSLYWVGIIAGRFLASRLADRIGSIRLLIVGSAIGGAVLVPALLSQNGTIAVVGFLVAGVLTGATIPLTITVAYAAFPGSEGSVTAFLSIFMLIGRIAGPWAIGTIGDSVGLDASIVLSGAALIVVAVLALIASRLGSLRPR